MAAAAAAYREAVAHPDAFAYNYEEAYMDPIVPSGVYNYAVIWLDSYQDVPGLLLRQEGVDGFNVVEVLQYSVQWSELHDHGPIPEGVNPKVHRNMALFVPEQRYGIIYEEEYFETHPGEITPWRYTLSSGGSEQNPNFGMGRGSTLDDPGRGEIIWYDVTDTTGIDNMAELAQGPDV